MKKNNNILNFNVEKDDHNVNDYIFCWSEFGYRPSKTTIHGYFKTEGFLNYLKELNITEISEFTDVIPNEEVSIINQKNFISINNELYLTYTHLDKEHEDSLISDVSIFHINSQKEKVDEIVNSLSNLIIASEEESVETKKNNLSMVNLNQNGFELEDIEIEKDFEDIEFFYEDSVLKRIKKVIKTISNEKKGLTILTGERGCGKTNLISYMTKKINKDFIYIPCNLIENTINNTEFRKFLKINKGCVLIIDDAEIYFSQMFSKSTSYTNNLLQLIEGVYSDSLKLNIILSLNCQTSEMDKILLESNEILDVIEVGKLNLKKIEELCEYLGQKSKFKSPSKLTEILKNKAYRPMSNELGFT